MVHDRHESSPFPPDHLHPYSTNNKFYTSIVHLADVFVLTSSMHKYVILILAVFLALLTNYEAGNHSATSGKSIEEP